MTSNEQQKIFLRLLSRHDPEIRAFIRASIPDPLDVAEVMQNVSVIAWEKFDSLENPESDFGKWACVVARYEILKFRRSKARDRLVLDDDIVEKLVEEGIEATSNREQWIAALEFCLQRLPGKKREILLRAYHPETSMKELAAELNQKPNALYQSLSRMRLSLVDCIEKNSSRDIESFS
ncbi:MAG: sigma-70 family RNA polymerase sigma factor [Verrucomicrobiales bacterium]|nr:sigma-70 family RNA polymerase sigma factor [Verrucomicrobiales bacterium]